MARCYELRKFLNDLRVKYNLPNNIITPTSIIYLTGFVMCSSEIKAFSFSGNKIKTFITKDELKKLAIKYDKMLDAKEAFETLMPGEGHRSYFEMRIKIKKLYK